MGATKGRFSQYVRFQIIGALLEEQMRIHSAEYWEAYEKGKAIEPIPRLAVDRLRRDEVHNRS